LTTCPKCDAVRMEGDGCHSCGWKPTPKPRRVEFAEGDLAWIERDRAQRAEGWTVEGQTSFYRQLLWIARQRQHRPGWAAHQYRSKFGAFPPWNWNNAEPIPPTDVVASWVRSRAIAYAKSMQRSG
jgi:DNA repair protein RadD